MKIYLASFLYLVSTVCLGQVNVENSCETSIETNPDTTANYWGGRKNLISTLNEYSLIPITEKQTDFPVTVKLLVCETGKYTILEIKARNDYHSSLEHESERILKLLSKFIPARKGGKNVSSIFWIQLNYKPKKKVRAVDQLIRIE